MGSNTSRNRVDKVAWVVSLLERKCQPVLKNKKKIYICGKIGA